MSKFRPASKEDQSLAKALLAANRFPWKLYQIVTACKSGAIGWDESGRTVLIKPEQFKRECLDPANSVFKTKNMGSFVRQLNLYGFHKLQSSRAGPDDQESEAPVIFRFHNELFIRGRLDLISKLHRHIGIRKSHDSCKGHQKHSSQHGSRMNGGCISRQSPMILSAAVPRSWSLSCDPSELNPSATHTSCSQVNCSASISSDCYIPLGEALKTEPREIIPESPYRSEIASVGREEDMKTMDVTVVKKEDFDKIVSIFVEMLCQVPDVNKNTLAQLDSNSSTLAHDATRRRAQIIRDYEAGLRKSVSPRAYAQTTFLPVHDSSFSFSANASTPIFKVANNPMDNTVHMCMADQNHIHNQCSCMNVDDYKENLAHI